MSLLQLLTRESDGRTVLEATPNPEGRPFRSFENEQDRAVVWGNVDLINVAVGLASRGFRAYEVSLVDQSLGPVEDPDLMPVVDELLVALNIGDRELGMQLLGDELFGLLIARVALRRRKPRRLSIAIHQFGLLEVEPDFRREDLFELQAALISGQ